MQAWNPQGRVHDRSYLELECAAPAAGAALVAHWQREVAGVLPTIVLGAAGGAVLGFWLHYLLLFLHEGAHYNLAPGRAFNDVVTNAAIGVFLGSDVRAYRKVHTGHHRSLGTPQDP